MARVDTVVNQTIHSYRDLNTWQTAKELCLLVYTVTTNFPRNEQFGLVSQMRRSAVSVPSNIAEGFGRQTAKDKQQFYYHSLGSLFELETQIDICSELGYLAHNQFTALSVKLDGTRRLLLALLRANRTKFPIP